MTARSTEEGAPPLGRRIAADYAVHLKAELETRRLPAGLDAPCTQSGRDVPPDDARAG